MTQQTATGKACPHCGADLGDPDGSIFIGTSQTVIIRVKDGEWVRDTIDGYQTYQCVACNEELTPEELDDLGVPNDIR